MTQTFARVASGIVQEIISLPDVAVLSQSFAPALAATMVACPSGTTQGQTYSGGVFGAAPGPAPPTQAQLLAYTNNKVAALLAIPKPYGPLGAGGPTVKCDGTTATGVSLAAINAWGTAAPTDTQPWLDDYGVATTITGAQGVLLAAATNTYARSVWAVAAAACTSILASTITTTAQIDALAWPT